MTTTMTASEVTEIVREIAAERAADALTALPAPVAIPTEPGILTANTYFWTATGSASGRRSNERRHIRNVAAYFEAVGGFTVKSDDASRVDADNAVLSITFTYSESCHNCYKHLDIARMDPKTGEWKTSNIKALRSWAAASTEERSALVAKCEAAKVKKALREAK